MDAAQYSCHTAFYSILRNDLTGLQETLKAYPSTLESIDQFSNTPLLYACYCGQSHIVNYLLSLGANYNCLNIFGQNALTLATYSDDIDTCNVILSRIDFGEFNTTGLLSPLCVAAMKGNTAIAQIYLTLEQPNPNPFDCPSESIHGVCPMRLAQFKGDDNMIDLLRSKHQLHIMKVSAIR